MLQLPGQTLSTHFSCSGCQLTRLAEGYSRDPAVLGETFPFSFTARPSKDKEEETLIQEAKAMPQAKAESKPGETSWFSPATFLPPVTQGLGMPSAPSGPVSWSDELALPRARCRPASSFHCAPFLTWLQARGRVQLPLYSPHIG